MKQIGQTLQLVLKEELVREELTSQALKDNLIHVGLGHSVFNVEQEFRGQLDELLSNYPTEKYYFRMSFVEDLSKATDTSRSYMTHDAKFFKPKVNGDILYFLGLNFVIIEIEKLERSEKFNIDNYRCVINKITVDAVTGNVTKELLWDKTKYGRIENYLPSKLKAYSAPVYQCRRRLFAPKNK
jgi:hypothetical protein